jgi:hypothetical protein
MPTTRTANDSWFGTGPQIKVNGSGETIAPTKEELEKFFNDNEIKISKWIPCNYAEKHKYGEDSKEAAIATLHAWLQERIL